MKKIRITYRAEVKKENFNFFKDGYYIIIDNKEPQKIIGEMFESTIEIENEVGHFITENIHNAILDNLSGTPFIKRDSIKILYFTII